MAEYQGVFERYEKKYMLNEQQYNALCPMLDGYMETDHYGLHTICNIYYDTPHYDLIRASIEKPPYKEKLRLRSYGIPKDDSTVFLELKKKYNGVVYKRRVPLTLSAAENYLAKGIRPPKDHQILHEIDWFLRQYDVSPKAFIAYDRIALFGTEDPNLRITFDNRIRWRDSVLDLSKGDWGNLLLPSGQILMEIKIPGTMPYWLAEMLTELEIFPYVFSKYGTCYKQHLIHSMNTTGGIICA